MLQLPRWWCWLRSCRRERDLTLRVCVKWNGCPFWVDRLQCLHLASQWPVGLLKRWWCVGVSVSVSSLAGWVPQKENSEKDISSFVRECS